MVESVSRGVLVTGAARRIGAAIATELGRRGWSVAVHHNTSGDTARKLTEEIAAAGGRAVALAADLMRDDEVASLVPRAVDALGPLSCLVNNASIFEIDTFKTASRDTWDAHMQVNVRAPFVLTQAFATQLPGAIEGNVINIIDQRVLNLTPHFTSYTLSKSALWTLTRTLALALAPQVRVNAIGPGPALPSIRQTPEHFVRQWSRLPSRRPTSPAEIASAVHFILDTPAMTGQMIALDGGQHLGWAPSPGRHGPRE